MNHQKARTNLVKPLRIVLDGFENVALPALKGRDKREPGHKEKQAFEDELQKIIVDHFIRQRKLIKQKLEENAYLQKKTMPIIDVEEAFEDEEVIPDLLKWLEKATINGINLFSEMSDVQIDWTLTNKRALDWAKKYVYKLIKNIDDTTRPIVKTAISHFIDLPGFTVGDTIDLLSSVFNEDRAQRIAITETTRAYAQATQMAGDDLKKEFPDVRVVKIWNTNNDYIDGVRGLCDLCRDLNGKEVEIDENFYEPDEYSDGNPPKHPGCMCWTQENTRLGEKYD